MMEVAVHPVDEGTVEKESHFDFEEDASVKSLNFLQFMLFSIQGQATKRLSQQSHSK